MPRPKRAARVARLPPDVAALFMIGCGANNLPAGEFERLWREYGETFCRQTDDPAQSWAVSVEGMPYD